MQTFLNAVTKFFDLLLSPFRGLSPVWGVAFLAFLTAVFMLLVYRGVSNQAKIRRIKKRVQGHFLGIYLFRDDLPEMLRSLGGVCAGSAIYVGHSLVPLAVIIVPVALCCVQMQLRYGYKPPSPGDRLIASLSLEPDLNPLEADAGLAGDGGLLVETPPLRIPERKEVAWSVRVERGGAQQLTFTVKGAKIVKRVSAVGVGRLYPVRGAGSLADALLNPGEEPLPGGLPVREVRVGYEGATVDLLGARMHWSIAYFLLAIVFGMIFKRFFGVEF